VLLSERQLLSFSHILGFDYVDMNIFPKRRNIASHSVVSCDCIYRIQSQKLSSCLPAYLTPTIKCKSPSSAKFCKSTLSKPPNVSSPWQVTIVPFNWSVSNLIRPVWSDCLCTIFIQPHHVALGLSHFDEVMREVFHRNAHYFSSLSQSTISLFSNN
jgi:hypothetical protein